MAIFGAEGASRASCFDVFTMFSARAPFSTQKNATSKNYQKITKKNNSSLVFSFFGIPPLTPNRPLPRAIFDGICDVLCTSNTLQKRAVVLPRGPHIAKAKARPHAMRFNMPSIKCLVHRRISPFRGLQTPLPSTRPLLLPCQFRTPNCSSNCFLSRSS